MLAAINGMLIVLNNRNSAALRGCFRAWLGEKDVPLQSDYEGRVLESP